eukprot:s2244_g8.t1
MEPLWQPLCSVQMPRVRKLSTGLGRLRTFAASTATKGGKGGKATPAKGAAEKWIQVKPTVLVTGCAGYVATGVVRRLLSEGYKVKGTVRSVDPSDPKVAMMKRVFPQVELCEADLLGGEEAFAKAMEGCKYVMHCASPFKLDAKDVQKELIEPAVKGTEAVMRAAGKANINRVVVTSSVAAVGPPMTYLEAGGTDKVLEDDDWNDDAPDTPMKGYKVSKVLAEKKAWELSKELNIDLAVLCPGFVIGPMMTSRADGESVLFMKRMLDGTMKEKAAEGSLKGFPKPVTDVRDLGLAHVKAMEKEGAVGKRFLVTSESTYTNVQMAEMIADRYKAYPLPTESQEATNGYKCNCKAAKDVLGVSLRPVDVSMRDMAAAALRVGLAEKKFVKKAAKSFGQITDIMPDSRSVYLLVSVVSIGTPEEGKGAEAFTEVVVGDSTGLVTLRLNSEEMKALGSVGDVVEIRNGAVKMMKESGEKGTRVTMMSVIEVKAAQVTHPTGDPKFAVMQPIPAAISEKEADPFLMCDEFGPTGEADTQILWVIVKSLIALASNGLALVAGSSMLKAEIQDHLGVGRQVWQAFTAQVGDPGNDIRLFGALPRVAVVAACNQAQFQDGSPLLPIQATQVGLVWRLCRRVVAAKSGMNEDQFVDIDPWEEPSTGSATGGNGPQGQSNNTPAGGGQSASIKDRVLKMSSLVDTQDESELLPPTNEEVNRWTQAYVAIMGSLPDPAEEPTSAQLAALSKRTLVHDCAPYVDFSVWTPFARRTVRNQKYRTVLPLGDGTYLTKELPGPVNFQMWLGCWRVFKSAALMLNICTLATLSNYERFVERLITQWPTCWGLIAQAEDKVRAEGLERWRRRIMTSVTLGRQVPVNWDPARPWTAVFDMIIQDVEYWAENVHHPAAAWLASGSRGRPVVASEVAIHAHLPGGSDWVNETQSDESKRRAQANRDRRTAKKKKLWEDREELKKFRQGQSQSSGHETKFTQGAKGPVKGEIKRPEREAPLLRLERRQQPVRTLAPRSGMFGLGEENPQM